MNSNVINGIFIVNEIKEIIYESMKIMDKIKEEDFLNVETFQLLKTKINEIELKKNSLSDYFQDYKDFDNEDFLSSFFTMRKKLQKIESSFCKKNKIFRYFLMNFMKGTIMEVL